MSNSTNSKYNYPQSMLYYTVLYLIIILTSMLCGFVFKLPIPQGGSVELGKTPTIENIAHILAIVLVLYTYTHYFLMYNVRAQRAYIATFSTHPTTAQRVKHVLKSKEYIIQLSCTLPLMLILPLNFGYFPIMLMFNLTFGQTGFLAKLFYILVIFPICAVVICFAHLKAIDDWKILASNYKKTTTVQGDYDFKGLRKKCIIAFILYTISFYCSQGVLPVFITIYNTLKYNFLQTSLFIVIFIVAIFFLVNAKTLIRRMRFIKALKKQCKESDFEILSKKRVYRSLFKHKNQANISIKAHGKIYDCMFLATKDVRSCVIFGENGEGIHEYQAKILRLFMRMKVELEFFKICTFFDYNFKSPNQKVIIMSPPPVEFFAMTGEAKRLIDNGEIVEDYAVYKEKGFLRALSVDIIGLVDTPTLNETEARRETAREKLKRQKLYEE